MTPQSPSSLIARAAGCVPVLLSLLALSTSQPRVYSAPPTGSGVPTVDELAGDWQMAADLLSLPALNSPLGSAQVASDAIGVTKITFPPITLNGETGNLTINGARPKLEKARWFPYQAMRTSSLEKLAIESAVRLPYAGRGVLYQVRISNHGAAGTFTVRIGLSATTTSHPEGWGWGVPRNKDVVPFSKRPLDDSRGLLLWNESVGLANCFAFVQRPAALSAAEPEAYAEWRLSIPEGGSQQIEYVLAVGENDPSVQRAALDWAEHFASAFAAVPTAWQQRFTAMFQPGNPHFSGHLPTLVTEDARVRRTYYMSAMTVLSLYRTCFPTAPRVYVSNSPESNCDMMYFWDTREFATALALLDPAMLKLYLKDWLAKGVWSGYAEEYLTGSLKGPWYSANDYSIFILFDAYMGVTQDHAFLSEQAGDKTILEHLHALATHWKQLVRPGRVLADYGKASNLLETVPSYINEVASFNAANVWMMRRLAAIDDARGDQARAQALRADARRLLPEILSMYERGQGVWATFHRDGTRVPVRHIFDYATVGLMLAGDLTPQVRAEMTDFVRRELLTATWMRAMSLSDPAAARSRRFDHGPMGAYCAWPAETAATMFAFGQYDDAVALLRACAAVTTEGPFSQSRKLSNDKYDATTRIAPAPQPYNASNGGAFMDTVIRGLFGFQPDAFDSGKLTSGAARPFAGRLENLRIGKRTFDIVSRPDGLRTEQR